MSEEKVEVRDNRVEERKRAVESKKKLLKKLKGTVEVSNYGVISLTLRNKDKETGRIKEHHYKTGVLSGQSVDKVADFWSGVNKRKALKYKELKEEFSGFLTDEDIRAEVDGLFAIGTEERDKKIELIVELFDNNFTSDDFKDGMPSRVFIDAIEYIIQSVVYMEDVGGDSEEKKV